jgi:D-alanyl-D-alanine carboxypeptidase (penicillin-binding protein 5/6)
VTADAAILVDAATGHVLYGKNEHHQKDPASLTKVMTAIVALEVGRPDDVVTVSKRAARFERGSIIDIRDGEQITLENLLKAALIMSANDSTIAIAEHVAGDYDLFIHWMNLKARELGATNTRFVNTHGFTHPNHDSTAYDLALIARYALRIPQFAALVRTRSVTVYWHNSDRKQRIRNTNRLLHSDFEGIDGVKTGTTSMAGHCLIASATRDGRQLIAVILHSDGRYYDAQKLLTYGFEIEPVEVATAGDRLTRLRVRDGTRPDVTVVPAETVKLPIPQEQLPKLGKEVRLHEDLVAPIAAGQPLGEMIFLIQGRELGRVALVAGYAVEREVWYKRLL